jgi:hypothetical protein
MSRQALTVSAAFAATKFIVVLSREGNPDQGPH